MTDRTENIRKDHPNCQRCCACPIHLRGIGAQLWRHGNTINVTIAAYRHIPDGKGKLRPIWLLLAHLRCTIAGAVALRNALNDAFLLGAPAGDKPN